MPAVTTSDRARAHGLSPEVRWYCESRGYEVPEWTRPLWRTPEPGEEQGARFDPARVDRVISALRALRHTQGEWTGKPLEPSPWQVAYVLAPIFGWTVKDADGHVVRWYRDAWVEVPRKNGKTTLSAAIMVYLAFADGEGGAQVLLAAGSKDQARLAYDPIALAVGASPQMADAGVRAWKSKIIRAADGAVIKPVASVGDTLQGTNPHGYLADEMHVHKDLDLIQSLETGTGARRQPLGFVITTADAGGTMTPYAVRRSRAENDCRSEPSRRYVVIFAAPRGADTFSEETWKRANPGYGVSPTRESMRAAAEEAKTGPEERAAFERLRLNRRLKQSARYIDLPKWDRSAPTPFRTLSDLYGRPVVGGLDLASVSDLAALCWLTPRQPGDPKGAPLWSAVWRTWTPEENLRALDKRTLGAATRWVEQGLLELTPGDVLDYDVVQRRIEEDDREMQIEALGFDPWSATQLSTSLYSQGLPMVKVRQGYASMSAPLKRMKALVYMRDLGHDNPIADWCIDNLAVARDPAGNVKPDKAKSGEKIDLVAALVTAMSQAMIFDAEREAQEASDEHGAGFLV